MLILIVFKRVYCVAPELIPHSFFFLAYDTQRRARHLPIEVRGWGAAEFFLFSDHFSHISARHETLADDDLIFNGRLTRQTHLSTSHNFWKQLGTRPTGHFFSQGLALAQGPGPGPGPARAERTHFQKVTFLDRQAY